MAETPISEARNAALAIVTALLDGNDEAAWAIARADDYDTPMLTILLGRLLALLVTRNFTPEVWKQVALDMAQGR
jgi:hypothetical protein